MEGATRRMCVAVMPYRQPTFLFDRIWPQVHGEARATLPALPEFLVLLVARRAAPGGHHGRAAADGSRIAGQRAGVPAAADLGGRLAVRRTRSCSRCSPKNVEERDGRYALCVERRCAWASCGGRRGSYARSRDSAQGLGYLVLPGNAVRAFTPWLDEQLDPDFAVVVPVDHFRRSSSRRVTAGHVGFPGRGR
ncbi:MAG: hypothetical protein U5Q44_09470 [Dehalococcoidia bacterium]|nr:hypothetical protein [Dehalococcoidia bacterium]